MNSKQSLRTRQLATAIALLALALTISPAIRGVAAMFGLTGAIFTTNAGCGGVNINIFASKDDVYLNGGPAGNGSGLPDGYYCVKVTDPSGANLLGQSAEGAVHVTNGKFDQCYQLNLIAPFANTPNNGGEYKVWVGPNCTFADSKTDNFKVDAEAVPANLHVRKFYDANANGVKDMGEVFLTGWQVRIQDNIDYIRFTPVDITVAPDDYVVTEASPVQTNWVPTTANPQNITLGDGEDKTVTFGNVCLGPGGGLTLGFWSNKNGELKMNDGGTLAPELALLSSYNLVDAAGSAFDPTTYPQFRTWILGANAVNMANMLSAQLAAMVLNVEAGNVTGNSLVYAPTLGFITINNLMAAANTALGQDGYTPDGDSNRATQEALKNALDKANNNKNFVQATACPFSF